MKKRKRFVALGGFFLQVALHTNSNRERKGRVYKPNAFHILAQPLILQQTAVRDMVTESREK